LFFILLVSCLAIINATIPISLYVTLEIVRIFQGLFVYWDATMYDPETESGCHCRTTTISDDLGQIAYIFSDKTGTLTQNLMDFMKCAVAGEAYGQGTTEVGYASAKRRGLNVAPPCADGPAFRDDRFAALLRSGEIPPDVEHFLWLLVTCHSVIPEEKEGAKHGIFFQAASPDEGTLVEAAADFGYVLKQRRQEHLQVCVNGNDVDVELLATLEFTSARKRSSVVIRHPTSGEIVLYCKGADDFIFSKLSEDSQWVEETKRHLKEFADEGLRTLCCGFRVLSEDFFEGWIRRFHEANCMVVGRDDMVERVAREVECELSLLGTTAIEDKLQVGVPAAIGAFLTARMAVWIITGDKRETAINIGFACSLLSSEMRIVVLDDDDDDDVYKVLSVMSLATGDQLAMIVGGKTLTRLVEDHVDTFCEFALKCRSVICFRVSPLQKATIVSIMRHATGKIVVAIGDGGNDVGMILQADVGIGVSGKEGRQAVLASDYAISQFRHLTRLLLVHGRLNFYRNVDLINYSFYKNMACSLSNVLIGFLSGWSGGTIFDSMLYMTYNVIFTSVAPVVYAAIERDVSFAAMTLSPELYDFDGKRTWMQSYGRFWTWIGIGVFHGLCAFFIPYFAMKPFVGGDGRQFGLKEFGIVGFHCVVVLANLQIASMSFYWTWLHHLFIWLSIAICPIATMVIDAWRMSPDLSGLSIRLFGSSTFWLILLATAMFGMIPVVASRVIINAMNTRSNQAAYTEANQKTNVQEEDVSDVG
jgi:phospholipid-translocating P-type ATPase (flippase)